MKKWVMAVSALVMAAGLAGCSSDYVMATKDGNMILTQGKPEIDEDTGLISYKDEKGNHRQINGDQVSQVIERFSPLAGYRPFKRGSPHSSPH